MAKQSKSITRFTNGYLLHHGAIRQGELWISNGTIIPPAPHWDDTIDAQGHLIAPGYIDLQVNGAYGRDFATDRDAWEIVARYLPHHGVTAFLPTLISTTSDTYQELLPTLIPAPGSAALGWHLEGPFLNPEQRGAHPSSHLRPIEPLEQYYGSLEKVKMVTLAPELPNASEAIHTLRHKGIIAAAGHTRATYAQALQAIQQGISLATHLFNAMRPFHHREPGFIGAALGSPGLPFTLIADGLHVHPAVVATAWKANPKGLILVSDTTAALGLKNGTYLLGGQEIAVHDKSAYLPGTQTLAGSAIGLDQAVRNLRAWSGCSIAAALEAASTKPAKILGLSKTKGCLDPGADADILLLDQDLHVLQTMIGGKVVMKREPFL